MMTTPNAPLYQDEYLNLRRLRHGLFVYNGNDAILGRSLDHYGEWFDAHLALMLEIISGDDIVLDVGANIGPHTIPLAQKLQATGGMVFAFEPQRLVFQNLCANITLNRLVNVFTQQVAVGRTPGTCLVPALSPFIVQSSTGVDLRTPPEVGETVPVIRLDDLPIGRCKLLKIDVEGMEPDVLDGALKLIKTMRPVLAVECGDMTISHDVLSRILAAEYDCWWHINDFYQASNFFQNPVNIFANTNPRSMLFCFHKAHKARLPHLIPVEGANDTWQKALSRAKP